MAPPSLTSTALVWSLLQAIEACHPIQWDHIPSTSSSKLHPTLLLASPDPWSVLEASSRRIQEFLGVYQGASRCSGPWCLRCTAHCCFQSRTGRKPSVRKTVRVPTLTRSIRLGWQMQNLKQRWYSSKTCRTCRLISLTWRKPELGKCKQSAGSRCDEGRRCGRRGTATDDFTTYESTYSMTTTGVAADCTYTLRCGDERFIWDAWRVLRYLHLLTLFSSFFNL